MAFADIDSRQAILDAVAEFAQIGREEFLKKYGYREAQRYFLEIDGKRYDSKAIVGVAHKYQFPAKGPLTFDEFSGGKSTVQRKLEKLGFRVVQTGQAEEGQTDNRDDHSGSSQLTVSKNTSQIPKAETVSNWASESNLRGLSVTRQHSRIGTEQITYSGR